MAKRVKLNGRSARHGRAPAPYTKYKKRPWRYPSREELARKYPSASPVLAVRPVFEEVMV